jgi:hypothetical protein
MNALLSEAALQGLLKIVPVHRTMDEMQSLWLLQENGLQ